MNRMNRMNRMKMFGKDHRSTGHAAARIALVLAIGLVMLAAGIAFASSGGDHAEAKGWEKTDTFRVMNFAVLMTALFFILKKPVAKALSGRIDSIRNQLEDLEIRKAEALKELAAYEDKISRMEQESADILARYKQQGEDVKKRILAEAASAAEKMKEQAVQTIEREFEDARNQLKMAVFEQALEKAEASLKEKITEDDQDKLVDEYLTKVVA